MGARVDTRMRSGASMIAVGTAECYAVERQVVVDGSWGLHLRSNSALSIYIHPKPLVSHDT